MKEKDPYIETRTQWSFHGAGTTMSTNEVTKDILCAVLFAWELGKWVLWTRKRFLSGAGRKGENRLGKGGEVLFYLFIFSFGERRLTRNWKVDVLVPWGIEILQPWMFLKNVHRLEIASWGGSQAKRLRFKQRLGLLLPGILQLFQKLPGESLPAIFLITLVYPQIISTYVPPWGTEIYLVPKWFLSTR